MLTRNHFSLPNPAAVTGYGKFPGFAVGTPRPQGDQEELSIGGEKTENTGMWMGCLQNYVPSLSKSSRKEG